MKITTLTAALILAALAAGCSGRPDPAPPWMSAVAAVCHEYDQQVSQLTHITPVREPSRGGMARFRAEISGDIGRSVSPSLTSALRKVSRADAWPADSNQINHVDTVCESILLNLFPGESPS